MTLLISNDIQLFKPISLSEMDEVALMKRVDTKFVVHRDQLKALFPSLQPHYKVLEIEGNRLMTYDSAYFDTKSFKFYFDHHNKKAKRTKIRIRKYVESDLAFLEIKQKDAKGNTVKKRIKLDAFSNTIGADGNTFIENTICKTLPLTHSLSNRFNRVTLVNVGNKERVTFDFNLMYNDNMFNKDLVIVELKQERLNRESEIFKSLKKLGSHPFSISKYCIGIATLHNDLKQNYFKSKFLKINKLIA